VPVFESFVKNVNAEDLIGMCVITHANWYKSCLTHIEKSRIILQKEFGPN
jgi:hypothetical protein